MKSILVVEELPAVQQFIRETLESKGYKTLGATNCDKAYDILMSFSQRINLVLMDFDMLESSGLELIKKIKENPDLKKIPIIFLTSVTNTEIIKEAEPIEFNSWVKKPYRSEVLMKEIETALTATSLS